MIFMIRIYQHTLGLMVPRVCRFEPTCSNYAIQSIQYHGSLKGSLLAALRILKCNPFFAGGYDPVPITNEDKKVRRCEGGKISSNDLDTQNEPDDNNALNDRNLLREVRS